MGMYSLKAEFTCEKAESRDGRTVYPNTESADRLFRKTDIQHQSRSISLITLQ